MSQPKPAGRSAPAPCPEWGHACLRRALHRFDQQADWRRAICAAGYDLGGVVAGGHLDQQLAHDTLLERALQSPLHNARKYPLRQVEKLVQDVLRRGARTPKHPRALRASGQAEVAEQVAAWRSTAEGRAWAGKGGANRLALLLALYEIAARVGRLSLLESVRELQDAAGQSSPAVTDRALRDLAAAGWLRRVGRGSRQTGSRSEWELLTPPAATAAKPDNVGRYDLEVDVEVDAEVAGSPWLRAEHDCWHRRPTAWLVASALAQRPCTGVSGLAEDTGLSRSTVRRALQWLVSEGVVVALEVGGREQRVYLVGAMAADAAEVSALMWPESPTQVRRRRHEQDRERHRRYRQALAEIAEEDRLREAWLRSLELQAEIEASGQAEALLR